MKSFNNPWVYIALVGFLFGVVLFVVVPIASHGTNTLFHINKVWMPVIMALAVISLISSIVATVKMKGYKKIATIFLALLTIPLFLIAYFTWWVSTYWLQ